MWRHFMCYHSRVELFSSLKRKYENAIHKFDFGQTDTTLKDSKSPTFYRYHVLFSWTPKFLNHWGQPNRFNEIWFRHNHLGNNGKQVTGRMLFYIWPNEKAGLFGNSKKRRSTFWNLLSFADEYKLNWSSNINFA